MGRALSLSDRLVVQECFPPCCAIARSVYIETVLPPHFEFIVYLCIATLLRSWYISSFHLRAVTIV